MMELRRMVMAQMAKGKDFITGTFTCPDADTTFTLNFGKTFNHYLFVIELSDDSKTALKNTGKSSQFSIGFVGIYPKMSINNVDVNANQLGQRYTPSTNATSSGSTSVLTTTNTSITGSVRGLDYSGTTTSILIRGYTYKYTVISLD